MTERWTAIWSRPPSDRLILWVLFGVALTVRLLYLLESHASNPFFSAPVVDAHSYLELARRIVAGDWVAGTESYWQPPGFPYLLALLLAICGEDGVYVGMRVVHAILGALSVTLVYRLGRGLGRRIAVGAATATALYGPLLYFEGELLAVALEIVLYLGLLWAMERALSQDQRWNWILCGLLAGAAAVTRPTILLFVVIAAALALAGRSVGRRIPPSRIAWSVAALGLVVAPVTVRNALVAHEFVLVSANGGINFYIGNHTRADSMVAIHPGMHWDRLVGEPLAAGATTAGQRSGYFYNKAVETIVEGPVGWISRMALKSWQLIHGPEIKRNQDPYFARQHSWTLRLLMWDRWLSFPHGLLAPLALWGLLVSWHRREPVLVLSRQFLAGYGLAVVLFFVTSRYRVPLVPVACLFAALGTADLFHRGKSNRVRLAVAIVIVGAFSILMNLPAAPPVTEDAQLYHDLGEVALRRDDFASAAAHSQRAVQLEADYPSAWHNLAVARMGLGQPTDAAEGAREALRLYEERVDTRLLLARALMSLGQTESAWAELDRATQQTPHDADVRYTAGRILLQAGQAHQALSHLEAAARLQPREYWMHYDLGRALHALGQLDRALTAFENAATLAPERADALSAAGAVALAGGDTAHARRLLQRALVADPLYRPARINLGLLDIRAGRTADGISHLEAAIDQGADPAPLWGALISAYRETGQTEKARAAMRAARAGRIQKPSGQ